MRCGAFATSRAVNLLVECKTKRNPSGRSYGQQALNRVEKTLHPAACKQDAVLQLVTAKLEQQQELASGDRTWKALHEMAEDVRCNPLGAEMCRLHDECSIGRLCVKDITALVARWQENRALPLNALQIRSNLIVAKSHLAYLQGKSVTLGDRVGALRAKLAFLQALASSQSQPSQQAILDVERQIVKCSQEVIQQRLSQVAGSGSEGSGQAYVAPVCDL